MLGFFFKTSFVFFILVILFAITDLKFVFVHVD